MLLRVLYFMCLLMVPDWGQTAPTVPNAPWPVAESELTLARSLMPPQPPALERSQNYTLPELVDLAETHNPLTRTAWERAKQRAAALGIARSALFPLLAATASASVNQYSLFTNKFNHEDTTLLPAAVTMNYVVFDFGSRASRIDAAKANLLAADFAFNNTHRDLAFHVAENYYRLLDALSQEDAARSASADAQTVREAVEARLANGLATLPDALEARASAAEAEYELASVQGLEDIARGDLADTLGVAPSHSVQVEDISKVSLPPNLSGTVEAVMELALKQRPDLLAQLARVRATSAGVRQARSAYDPVLSFSGSWGHSNGIGQQKGGPEVHSAIYPYQAQFNLTWTIFDGGARRNELRRARSEDQEARDQVAAARDQIENEIWTAYTHFKTAQQQQDAAESLLAAAEQSYSSALEAFQAGVRTFLDVSSSQKSLARARAARVGARIRLLGSIAELAYRAAEPIPGQAP